jgi:predicted protein tyrosine phosphatase
MTQIADAIEFGRRVIDGGSFFDGPSAGPPLIAIHCEHGKSRSAAVALALLADRLGDGRERDAVNTLLRGDIENRMHPTMQHLQNFALVTRNGRAVAQYRR